jgi:hypothetical protein
MLTAKLILERFDKDHQLLERRELPSRSFTLGFVQLLYVAHTQLVYTSPYSMTNIDGVAKNVDSGDVFNYLDVTRTSKCTLKIGSTPGSSEMILYPGTGIGAYNTVGLQNVTFPGEKIGIVVGTGVNAVTPTDTKLQTRILHGTGAGLLEYGGCELLSIAFADPNGQFTIRRYFTNNSGGLITIQEAGIYAAGGYSHYNAGYSNAFCIARDLTGGVAVADTELLRVTYVVQITV